jgi:hypothetical protein
MKRGVQKELPLNNTAKQHTYMIGVYDGLCDQVVVQRAQRLDRNTIVDFLMDLFSKVYPEQNLVLILDNARFHWAKDVLACMALFEDRVRVIWLPKYSPELNLIERFWQHLKKTVCANRLHASIDDLYQDVTHFIQQQNDPNSPDRISFYNSFLL